MLCKREKRHTGRKAGTRGVAKGAAGYVSNTPATLFVDILALLGVFLCGVECCPRFPLRRQNKEATRSTPRTAQRAHTGLFTRLKGRGEPPHPPPGEATASLGGFYTNTPASDSVSRHAVGTFMRLSSRIVVRNDGRCGSRGPRLVAAAAAATTRTPPF